MNVRVNHVKMAGHATFVMMVTFAPVLMDMAVMSVNVNVFFILQNFNLHALFL